MSDFLFARPSIIEGIGRTIDLFGIMNEYNYARDGAEADRTALINDIAVLKSDFLESYQEVIGEYSR
jgi:hypothetical protein